MPKWSQNFLTASQQNVIKDPHWYAVQVSDTTMLTIAVALLG